MEGAALLRQPHQHEIPIVFALFGSIFQRAEETGVPAYPAFGGKTHGVGAVADARTVAEKTIRTQKVRDAANASHRGPDQLQLGCRARRLLQESSLRPNYGTLLRGGPF